MSDTPMSKERLTVLEHDGHLARVEALTTTSVTLGHELQDACREIRRLQELVDELGDALIDARPPRGQTNHEHVRKLLIRVGKLEKEDVVR